MADSPWLTTVAAAAYVGYTTTRGLLAAWHRGEV